MPDRTERSPLPIVESSVVPATGGRGGAHVHADGTVHSHSHDGHAHSHLFGAADPGNQRRLRLALLLTGVFFVAEVVGGLASNSLALLADAGHMFTDVAALGLSLFVAWFSRQPSTPEKTYGYLRWEILAAFFNGTTLLLVSAGIIWEAFSRLRAPEPLESGVMLLVAIGGLLVNTACAWILHPVHQHSLNTRGAYLHVLGDLLGSVGTVLAALLIRWTGWLAADPIVSVLVTLLIVRSSWRLMRESIDVLLEATPAHISLGAVRSQLERIDGVASVHDLHVWTVTSGMVAMSAHAIVPDGESHQRVLCDVVKEMRGFGIAHVTMQIEREELCVDTHP
jgi:cobalt-zinc-cadmium efflux system protein